MRIVYHLGAHCTDEERLIRCLLKNRGLLSEQGIVVPGPNRYRNLLRDTAIALKGQPASTDTQALVLEQIMDEDRADRLILSWENFLSFAPWAVDHGRLYPAAAERVRAFSQIFPEIEAEFHLAIRNPASFLPALYDRQKSDGKNGKTHAAFMKGVNVDRLRWSDVVASILAENPGVPLTIWSDEDTPLIWPEVLQAVSGHAPGTVLEDGDDVLAQIMSAEGLARLRSYLKQHPPATTTLRRKVVTAFLDKFAQADKIDVEVEMPDWLPETVAEITAAYDRDVARIAAMPGVRFLAP
jgi:hypothetical protein